MDKILSLLQDFDVAKLLPTPVEFTQDLQIIMRVIVMVAPLVVLGLGLWYYLAPPKEANYAAGFRVYRAMGSVEAWQFTQRLAGQIYCLLGIGLTVIMSILCNCFMFMSPMTMATVAMVCVVVEALLILAAWVYIRYMTGKNFDKKGNRIKKEKKNTQT